MCNIYICLVGFDHEGTNTDGVYTSLKSAKQHQFSDGHYLQIERWSFNKKGDGTRTARWELTMGEWQQI